MKRILIFIEVFVGILIMTHLSSCNLAPGSYPYAEGYEVSASESAIIDAVERYKFEKPNYQLPKEIGLLDGRRDEKDHWYHIYFYYPEEKKIIKTWVRRSGKNKTTFAFVGVSYTYDLGNWLMINDDLSGSENRIEKKKFEERILNKIEEYLVHKSGIPISGKPTDTNL